jgi:hypothetical protein
VPASADDDHLTEQGNSGWSDGLRCVEDILYGVESTSCSVRYIEARVARSFPVKCFRAAPSLSASTKCLLQTHCHNKSPTFFCSTSPKLFHRTLAISNHSIRQLQALTSTMAANEVNDIVMRLLAAADRMGGRERDEILHHVGRLSRAASHERAAAIDEMQRLRKKVVQQSAEIREIKRIIGPSQIFPATRAPHVAQPPLVSDLSGRRLTPSHTSLQAGGYGRATDARLQALGTSAGRGLDYGADHGRLSRPAGLLQPQRKASISHAAPPFSHAKQQLVPAGIPAMSAALPQNTTIEERPGYGRFNQARLLALQSPPTAVSSPNEPSERYSLTDGPVPPKYNVTAANAEPVVPRGRYPNEPTQAPASVRQAVDDLLDELDEIGNSAHAASTGQKRKASHTHGITASAAKRQLVNTTPSVNSYAMDWSVTSSQALILGPAKVASVPNQQYDGHQSQQKSRRPTCTYCFMNGVSNCDGEAHCGQGLSHKCYYVLCNPATCLGATCVKIHSSQYDLDARTLGEPRRLVIGDFKSVPKDQWHKLVGKSIIDAMGRGVAMPIGKQLAAFQARTREKKSLGHSQTQIHGKQPFSPFLAHTQGKEFSGPFATETRSNEFFDFVRPPIQGKPSLGALPNSIQGKESFSPLPIEAQSKESFAPSPNQTHSKVFLAPFSTQTETKQPFAAFSKPSQGKHSFAGLPVPTESIFQTPEYDTRAERSNSLGHHPFNVPKAVRDAANNSRPGLLSDPALPNTVFEPRSIKVELGND